MFIYDMLQVIMDSKDCVVCRVYQANLVHQVLLVMQDPRALEVLTVHLVTQVRRDKWV